MSDTARPLTLRDRRRAETVADIKRAAMSRIADGGQDAMTLRGVARDVGVSVQALYHYFPSRDALVTALIADSYNALADAVRQAVAGGRVATSERAVAAGLAYRRWAMAHRSEFLLTFGVPLTDYAAPEAGPTTAAAGRLDQAFRAALFDGWSSEELLRVPLPIRSPSLTDTLGSSVQSRPGLPPGAFAYFTYGWATLHGLVMLELLGHVPWVGDDGADMCRAALTAFTTQLDAVRLDPLADAPTPGRS